MVRHTKTIRRLLPMNVLSVFDHFVGLALKKLIKVIKGNTSAICEICSNNKDTYDVILVLLLLTLNIFRTLFRSFLC